MKLHILTLREQLLKEIYELAKLELCLEQTHDQLAEPSPEHSKTILKFTLERLQLEIRMKKYDIQHLQDLIKKDTF